MTYATSHQRGLLLAGISRPFPPFEGASASTRVKPSPNAPHLLQIQFDVRFLQCFRTSASMRKVRRRDTRRSGHLDPQNILPSAAGLAFCPTPCLSRSTYRSRSSASAARHSCRPRVCLAYRSPEAASDDPSPAEHSTAAVGRAQTGALCQLFLQIISRCNWHRIFASVATHFLARRCSHSTRTGGSSMMNSLMIEAYGERNGRQPVLGWGNGVPAHRGLA